MTDTAKNQVRTELPPQYAPVDVESRRYEQWVADGRFAASDDSDKPAYTIVIPPPNVTGSLHLGHAQDHTVIDALTRRARMRGYEALWMPGMDHAGISTQNVVERGLAEEGLSRHDLGREKFIERVWDWKAEYGGKISGQMRRLGDAVDWDRERFTMDEGLSRAVQTIFKRLYEDDLIYRAERIINWCPRCMTALSDIEVEHTDDDGELVSIRYGDGDSAIVVATTRAETMLGDTAVAVHPDDERYAHLVGTEVELPLTGRRIPVIADEHVDPEFGTGAVKVTPAHDPNDFEIGQRHGLPQLVVMDERGNITVHGPFEGLDRFEARPAVVAALRAEGRIVAEKRPYVHAVGHCERCGTTVEPRLSKQWFVKVAPLAKAAGDAVRDGEVRIHPPEQEKRYFGWVDNIHDWCISRQLWWGHRIPIFYGPDGDIVCVGPDETAPAGYTQDPDVLDTWFSSALWPFSTLGWPDQTTALEKFYPNTVLSTGYDILFFWVVRMMMFGIYAMEKPPFKDVFLHGLIRDEHGKKMSKSRGNGVDPLDLMDAYGSDAVRFFLAHNTSPGGDLLVNEEWVQGSRNFCNKLWNASRFALMSGATVEGPLPQDLSTIDTWILSRLARTVEEVDAYYDRFEFAKMSDTLYHFAWDEVCDWYLELAKPVLYAGGPEADKTRRVLGHVLDQLLRLLHPVIPFITEELWLALTGGEPRGESIMVAEWPASGTVDTSAEETVTALQHLVTEIRRFRSDQGLKPGQRVATKLVGLSEAGLADHETLIRSLARLDQPGDDFTASATLGVTEAVTAQLDTRGNIDVAAERARLDKALAVARKELDGTTRKLSNEGFLSKAPDEVVAKIRQRQTAAESDIARLTAQREALPAA
ncbi:valyl-tRNA synthetase [Stackebrandtia endophytica]|uniref:Valine--tRNA ligase n=1 Tax=Stackebrandtia endophytica TaxID=1496996 RepID=A0A543AU97_9ACTN|nr:valine--tRNA ligase [Stackebrandtia endophytica]TQL76168.1 valyl-tRNA synthetase [Stackebrandtia endophytica]